MWVKLKDNFLDLHPNRELEWLFWEKSRQKFFSSVFSKVCISDLHALIYFSFWWCLFGLVFLLPFLKTTCVWLSVLLGAWCHFPWLQREIQHPRWEPCKINNRVWTSDCLLLGKEARWFRDGDVNTALKFTDPSISSQLHPRAYGEWGDSTELKGLSWFLAPRGIACMETRRLIAEPQASHFSHGELISWTKVPASSREYGEVMRVCPVGYIPQQQKLRPRYVFRGRPHRVSHPWSFGDKRRLFVSVMWAVPGGLRFAAS